MDLRTNVTPTPPLSEQTPGLDKSQRVRALALRTRSYVAARPKSFFGVIGGIIMLGVGAWLAFRRRRR